MLYYTLPYILRRTYIHFSSLIVNQSIDTDTVIFWYVCYKFTFHPAHTPLNPPADSQVLRKAGIWFYYQVRQCHFLGLSMCLDLLVFLCEFYRLSILFLLIAEIVFDS